jgi:hypothetical protein
MIAAGVTVSTARRAKHNGAVPGNPPNVSRKLPVGEQPDRRSRTSTTRYNGDGSFTTAATRGGDHAGTSYIGQSNLVSGEQRSDSTGTLDTKFDAGRLPTAG